MRKGEKREKGRRRVRKVRGEEGRRIEKKRYEVRKYMREGRIQGGRGKRKKEGRGEGRVDEG
jgi:hypothetical protein